MDRPFEPVVQVASADRRAPVARRAPIDLLVALLVAAGSPVVGGCTDPGDSGDGEVTPPAAAAPLGTAAEAAEQASTPVSQRPLLSHRNETPPAVPAAPLIPAAPPEPDQPDEALAVPRAPEVAAASAPAIGVQPALSLAANGAIADSGCAVSLNRALLARGVENREPFGVDNVFSTSDERVFVFLDVRNPHGPERQMVVHWDHLESNHTYTQSIPAGQSVRWRTWLYHTIRPGFRGPWEVHITDDRSCVVGALRFEAQASGTSGL